MLCIRPFQPRIQNELWLFRYAPSQKLSGPEKTHDVTKLVLEAIDTVAKPTAFPLQFRKAEEVAKLLKEIYADLPANPKFTADVRTNVVLVNGTSAEIEMINSIIDMLDQPDPGVNDKKRQDATERARESMMEIMRQMSGRKK